MDINTISDNTRCHILKQCGNCGNWEHQQEEIGICKAEWTKHFKTIGKVKTLARGHCKEWEEK